MLLGRKHLCESWDTVNGLRVFSRVSKSRFHGETTPVVLVHGLDHLRIMPGMLQRALSASLVAIVKKRGCYAFQNLQIIRLALQHALAELNDTAIVVQIDGGFHHRSFEFGAAH